MKPYYNHGGITIYHGDNADVIACLDCEIVNTVVTSPPYNTMAGITKNKPSGLWADRHGGAGFSEAWRSNGYVDDMDEGDYQAHQNALFSAIKRVCRLDASLFYNHQLRWRDGVCLHPVRWFSPQGWNLRQEIVWARGGGMMLNARMFVRTDERILWFVGDEWKWNQSAVGVGTVWRVPPMQSQQGKVHPVEYPITLPARCIAATMAKGDLVLDPYMGGGTTLRAAKDAGMRGIGIEREERYCEVAARRMEQESLFGF